jgi:AraC-like DNA-binding protein
MHGLTTVSIDRRSLPADDTDGWATGIAQLLEMALAEIDSDRQTAKTIIAKARSLLRIRLDRASAGFPQVSVSRRLTARQIRDIARFIEEHIAEPIRIEALCSLVGLSPSHFARSFKRTLGEPPHAYLIRRRVEHACHLMLVGDNSLAEIAQACGFADQAHFSRTFRKRTGRSPMLWRCEQKERQNQSGGAEHQQFRPVDVRGPVRAPPLFR